MDSGIWQFSPATLKGFIALLLMASFKPRKLFWRGAGQEITLPIGGVLTSLPEFSKVSRLSVRQSRTCWADLEKLGISTHRSTRHGTLITIIKYAQYQESATHRSTHGLSPTGQEQGTNRTRLEEVKTLTLEERKERRGEILALISEMHLSFKAQDDLIAELFGEARLEQGIRYPKFKEVLPEESELIGPEEIGQLRKTLLGGSP